MESNNNGKIAVGILTMFIVAISIIGVTYAYFTAQFSPNLNPESVKVTAGNLMANYKNAKNISVANVVPGWVSDGLHYYDIDEAATHGGNIYAIKTTYEYTQQDGTKATANMGLAMPLEFSVENISDISDTTKKIDYVISLKVIQNGIYDGWTGISDEKALEDPDQGARKTNLDGDRKGLYATLYRGTFDVTKDVSDNYGLKDESGNPINKVIGGPYNLADTGIEQIMVKVPESIAVGETNNYFVIFKFANNPNLNQISQGIRLNVEADVYGVQKDNDASVTYASLIDAETPKITAGNMIVRDEGTSEVAVTKENQAKAARLTTYKNEHGTKTVWYNEDNEVVLLALTAEENSDGFDNDVAKVN